MFTVRTAWSSLIAQGVDYATAEYLARDWRDSTGFAAYIIEE